MDVTYYPGCSLESSARDYDESIKAVCQALGINLQEPKDWTCCGATSAHSLKGKLAIDLPARNLPAAERMGQAMLVPCPLCFNRLIRAKAETRSGVNIHDMASFMAQPTMLEKIGSAVTAPLTGISAVCYYGCMANRPPKITGSIDYENPMEMDHIAAAGRPRPQATPYPGSNLFSLASGGAIYVRDPHRMLVEEQLNGGAFDELTHDDWRLILPFLRENENLFGISVEEFLLTVDGVRKTPEEVYWKIIPQRVKDLAGAAVVE